MTFRRGQRVIVPWGFDEVEGTVVDAFGLFVTVRVDVSGTGEPSGMQDIGFKVAEVRPAPAKAAS